MRDKVFLDSNVLIFAYSFTEIKKQEVARKLITNSVSYLSTQVLQEFVNILHKKFKFSFEEIRQAINESQANNIIHINTEATIHQACKIADRYKYSFYDSLIISAALECDCKFLYTEDLQHGQVIEKKIKIVNPFDS